MNYFNRRLPNKNKLENCLENISKEVDTIFKTNTNDKNFIRLHSSTLGKEEFLAFSKAILEGNITLGYYNAKYESLAKEVFTLCQIGKRSEKASKILMKFEISSKSIEGGIIKINKKIFN